jgi:MFS transporter, PAT family, solute carrier family 33 (acetyl-CoA transportor), member 1
MLKLVDLFTLATCIPPTSTQAATYLKSHPEIDAKSIITTSFSCALEADKNICTKGGGICQMQRDGYYMTNIIFVVIGAITFWGYIERKALALQALPLRAWRVASGGGRGDYRRVEGG